jgi:hypothetical protein
MKRVLALLAAVLTLVPALATADEGDTATISRSSALIGEQLTMTLQVRTAAGGAVEVDPAAESWAGVEFVRLESVDARLDGDSTVHTLVIVVAPFLPGLTSFSPVVNVVEDSEVTPRILPAVNLDVVATLGPDDPLQLRPLPPPVAIEGAPSPLLQPAIWTGTALGALLVAAVLFVVGRRIWRRLRPARPAEELPVLPPSLAGPESLLYSDPVAAYRALAAVIRKVVGARYGIPAVALTSREVERRMEVEGIDRFQARLVGGFLQECDAVVYAGYRPAIERRQADMTMAREIVEAS